MSRQLSWSHILALLPIKDPLEREFYAMLCVNEGWSVRVLRETFLNITITFWNILMTFQFLIITASGIPILLKNQS
ncbi:MAG: hypothetical protein II467_00210 [Bacilli bacterium]|nr:hypothetical protein [Bacilli bacterium]MBQ4255315.1 hypothetical protein [Bacilli bacterium]